MSACGATMHAVLPVFDDAVTAKVVFGIAHSVLGVILVRAGGFALFEKLMSVCIGVMFVVVSVTAVRLWPGTEAIFRGLLTIDASTIAGDGGLTWTVALMGGVGGTVTVLCYGYWIRECGRSTPEHLWMCRVDLAVGYVMTAVFGCAMVIIGSTVAVEGKGASLIVDLSARLEGPLGAAGKWAFLLGAWGAVFSSLLGVWQAVPYLFADVCSMLRTKGEAERERDGKSRLTESRAYKVYLFAIASVPVLALFGSFREIQKAYAIVGAAFVPLLAIALLVLNGRRAWVGRSRNGVLAHIALACAVALLGWIVVRKVVEFVG